MQILKNALGMILIILALVLLVAILLVGDKIGREGSSPYTKPIMPLILFIVGIRLFRRISVDTSTSIVYADVGSRGLSLVIDGIISMSVLFATHALGTRLSFPIFSLFYVFIWILMVFLTVYFLAAFGGTPGKLAVGIRVVKIDHTPISIREAILRPSINITFGILAIIAAIHAFGKFSYHEYQTLPLMQKSAYVGKHFPPWNVFVAVLQEY